MHCGPDHAVTWHCHPSTQVPVSLPYQKMKQLFVSGDEAKKALEGEGHKVENRTKYEPFSTTNHYDLLRHTRQQQLDTDGRTVMAKTMEHSFVYDFVRTATPEAKGNTRMHENLHSVHVKSEQNRLSHGRKRPLSNDDLLKISESLVPSKMMPKLSEWLMGATVEEKEEYRRVLGKMRTLPRRLQEAPISAPEQHHHHHQQQQQQQHLPPRPATSSSMSRPGTMSGSRPGTAAYMPHADPNRTRVVQQVISDVKAKILRKVKDGTTTRQEIINSFKFFDHEGTGKLPNGVIKEVLSGVNVDVNMHQLEKIAQHLGFDEEEGMMEYRDFIDLLSPPGPGDRPRTGTVEFKDTRKFTDAETVNNQSWDHFDQEKLLKLLRVKLDGRINGQSNALRNAFRHFDKDGSGRIDPGELQEVLDMFGIYVPMQQCSQLIRDLDPDGDGSIDFIEFVNTVLEPEYDESVRGGLLFGPGRRPTDGPQRLVRLPPGQKHPKYYIPSRTKIRPNFGSDAATVTEGLRKQVERIPRP